LTSIVGIQGATHYPLPYQIGGVSVSLNGDPAPLLAVANLGEYQQINIQMPTGGRGTIEVSQSGNTGNSSTPCKHSLVSIGARFLQTLPAMLSFNTPTILQSRPIIPPNPAKLWQLMGQI